MRPAWRRHSLRGLLLGGSLLWAGLTGAGSAGQAAPAIIPASDKEKAQFLAGESGEQAKLRAELAALTKAGQKIYFNANCAGNNDIYVMGPDGSGVTQLTKDPAEDNYPHCSADGKRIVFTSNRIPLRLPLPGALKSIPIDSKFPLDSKGKWNRLTGQASALPVNHGPGAVVWVMNADGSEPRPVAFGALPNWSPDGKFIAYTITSPPFPDQLAVMNLEKGAEACIAHPALKNCGYPAFSPDGNYIVGTHPAGYVIKLNADKTAAEKVTMFDDKNSCNGELSADGKWWFYVIDSLDLMGSYILARPMNFEKPDGAPGSLPLGWPPGSSNYFPAMSPDGQYLVYAHADRQPGIRAWLLQSRQELYVTRFPRCGVTVRITWNGAANQHPHWVAQ